MSRPSKPVILLNSEKKSHYTKSQLKSREEAEKSLSTGQSLKERPEVKSNPVAHKEFLRIDKLLKNIKKNDAIYEPIINRYCMLQAECVDLLEKRQRIYEIIEKLDDAFESEIEYTPEEERGKVIKAYSKTYNDNIKLLLGFDNQIQTKRRMMLDIEKENIMTIAAALRSIPKKEEKSSNKLLEALNGS